MMDYTKDSVLEGITGLLRSYDLAGFINSIRRASGDNIKLFTKMDSPESTATDVSRLRKYVNSKIVSRLSGIVSESDVDERWVTEVLGVGTIQTLGKVPVGDLKYLESDLIEIFTNGCMNASYSIRFSLLKPNVSLFRMLLSYMFIRYLGNEIRLRLRLEYDNNQCSQMVSDIEIRRANTTVTQLNDKSKVRDKMLSYLKELDAIAKNQKAIDSLISKLAISADKVGLWGIKNLLYQFGSCESNICFLADRINKVGIMEYHYLIIPIVASNYGSRFKYLDGRNDMENPIEDWNLFYNALLVPALLIRNTQTGYLGLSVLQDEKFTDFSVQRKIASVSSISTYGNLDKSYQAFEEEVAKNYNERLIYLGYQSFVEISQYNQLMNLLISANLM